MDTLLDPILYNLFKLILTLSTLLTISYSTDVPACNRADQAILLQIKAQIKSPSPGIGDLSDWAPNTNCCLWPFVGCTSIENPFPGRINAVTISGGSGLVGHIPEVIGNLPFLEEIMFFDERKLTGPLPQSLSKLKRLEIIYLNSNGLMGPIPAFLGGLKRLREVDISDNRFTGIIPPSLSGLPKLASFNLSHNMLTGAVPNLQVKSLKSFDVSVNKLCGPIPTALKKFNAGKFGHNKCLCGPPLAPCK